MQQLQLQFQFITFESVGRLVTAPINDIVVYKNYAMKIGQQQSFRVVTMYGQLDFEISEEAYNSLMKILNPKE